jgi:metal-dependent amidase/aminoacylase/carboxypeptidase family protein
MAPTLRSVAATALSRRSRPPPRRTSPTSPTRYPGLFLFLGVAPDDPELVYPNHSPRFYADERALPVGVRALTALTLDYMAGE